MSVRINRTVQGELRRLVTLDLLTFDQLEALAPRYPTTAWDILSLVRWLSILGAVSFAAGILILVPKVVDLQNAIDLGLVLAMVGSIAGGLWLERRRALKNTGAALQLVGSFCLQGFLTAMAIRFSTGSKDWPALVIVCAVATGILAYALGSRLVLIHALVNAFVGFGGETGYMSGWGMYWLNMDYPTRFVGAGLAALGLAWVHARYVPGIRQGFSRVYAHFGLLVLNLALWFFSLFGFFNGPDHYRWGHETGSRVVFSVVWGLLSLGALFGGARFGLRLARAYGLTFLLIDVYTFYFQFIVWETGTFWFFHLLFAGGSMVALGFWLEGRLRHEGREDAVATSANPYRGSVAAEPEEKG